MENEQAGQEYWQVRVGAGMPEFHYSIELNHQFFFNI